MTDSPARLNAPLHHRVRPSVGVFFIFYAIAGDILRSPSCRDLPWSSTREFHVELANCVSPSLSRERVSLGREREATWNPKGDVTRILAIQLACSHGARAPLSFLVA